MPVIAVNSGCANGAKTIRIRKVPAVAELERPSGSSAESSPYAVPRYRMFSVNANPAAVMPAAAIPETTLSRCRRRKRNSSRIAAAFVVSSTTGAINVAPNVSASRGESTTTEEASQSVAKPLARIATSVAAHAPHANANRWVRHGAGSGALSQRNAASSSGTGKSASPKPTSRPVVPVCSRTSARIISPHSASSTISVVARKV
ncbi:hypothetical protein STAL104432_32020 [Streptomyces albus]